MVRCGDVVVWYPSGHLNDTFCEHLTEPVQNLFRPAQTCTFLLFLSNAHMRVSGAQHPLSGTWSGMVQNWCQTGVPLETLGDR